MKVATAPRRDSKHWANEDASWSDVCGWVDSPADHKECGNYLLGELKKTTIRHPGEDHDCTAVHRNKDAVVLRSAIVLDADTAYSSLPDLVELVLGYMALLHTTFRSTPDHPRYRTIFPTDRPMTPAECAAITGLLMDKLGRGQFDEGSLQPERYMFLPSCDPAHPEYYESRVIDGDVLCVDELLAEVVESLEAVPVEAVAEAVAASDIPAEVVREQVALVLASLDELASLADGERMEWPGMPDGVGWDVGGLYIAGRLVEAGNTGNGYTLHDAREDFLRHSPPAEGTYDPVHKWSEAVKYVGTRTMPYTPPASDFGSVKTKEPADGEMHSGQVRMAYRLARDWQGRLMFVHGIGWHYWDGKRWALDKVGQAERAVVGVVREALPHALRDKRLRADVVKCDSASGIRGVLAVASILESFAHTADQMDPDPWLINADNGTLDLRDRKLRQHNPNNRITKVTLGSFNPIADQSTWLAFLEEILPNDEERSYFQRVIGQSCYGVVQEHIFPVLTGTGANGKGTAYSAICSSFGDYATVVSPEMLMTRNSSTIGGPEMMVLRGARLVVASELSKDRELDDSTMKRLTGGDKLTARHLFHEPVTWLPTHQLLYVTNHLPRTHGDDEAVWRRMRVLQFLVVIAKARQDPKLGETLTLHADAILTWAIQGLWDYEDHGGMREPKSVVASTAEYRKENDSFSRFLEECCERKQGVSESSTALYEAWLNWQHKEGVDQMTLTAFGLALKHKGFRALEGSRHRGRRTGLRLLTDFEEET